MSEHPHGATTIRASKGGGGSKWVIGAIAAVVLAGGAYGAWKVFSPSQDNTEIAYNDPYAAEPLRAGPLADEPLAESAATEEAAPPSATVEPRSAAPSRRATARAEAIPEETIGITPVSASSEESAVQDDEEVIVRAPQRPVWARTPSERRLSSLYPVRALERGREGEARLSCTVQDGGALACATVEETPGGFGNAALRVARSYRHAPTRADGSDAIGTPLNLRVVFRLEDEERAGRRFAAR